MIPATKVASYSELRDCIDALPPLAPGLVRVYRGQPHNYPLLPSGRRRLVPRADIWAHYLRRLVAFIERTSAEADFDSEVQIWLVWLQALAQHYGAGSNYLDVTHDLGIAIWFALHTSKTASLETVVGPPNTTEQDSIVKTTWVRLVPHNGPAYLYVLDLKLWAGDGLPDAGELVDLAKAPETFHSKRIRVQSGCLVYAEEHQELGEPFLRSGMPIELAPDFDGSPYASRTVEQIFPPPAEDSWYARFLGLPFLLTPDEADENACFRQSLPVTLFLSSPDSPYVSDIRSRFHHLLPALVYPVLVTEPGHTSEEWLTNAAPENATVIVLEGPQISAHPPVESPLWNHDLLMCDWVNDADTFEIATHTPIGRTTLQNVVIEFSPLEEVAWYESDARAELLRAMWIVRGPGGAIAVYPVFQDYPGFRLAQSGPILLRLNSTLRRLEWWAPGKQSWLEITDLKPVGKAILSCLVLLRDLSPVPKLAAYPELESDAGLDLRSVVVPISTGVARLYRATRSDAGRPWHVLRHPDGEPYTTAKPNLGVMSIQSPTPFGQMTAAELRRYLATELEKKS